MGPGADFREDSGFALELEASPCPPSSRGRNAKDQLSTELRLPFRGAPSAGPSREAELTGSVCRTGRAALAKNSALPRATCARRVPGRRRGSPSRDVPGAQSPARAHPGLPDRRPRRGAGTALAPQAPRRAEGPLAEAQPGPSGMGAGGPASRAPAWASLPLLGPPGGAREEDSLCGRGKPGARSAGRRGGRAGRGGTRTEQPGGAAPPRCAEVADPPPGPERAFVLYRLQGST